MRRSAHFDKVNPTQEIYPLVIQSAQREESAARLLLPRRLRALVILLLMALSTSRVAAQTPTQPSPPSPTLITLDQAIDLALRNSPTLKATRTQIEQNKAQETTANLRPNPLLSWDAQFLPLFQPENFNSDFINQNGQFDLGIGYLFELGGKRRARLRAARDATTVTTAQVGDAERTLKFNVAQQFINALLAKSNLNFALKDLSSFQDTVRINEERYKAGDISKNDYLKIRIQLLQNESAVAADRLAKAQALLSLRQLIGYQSVPRDYDVAGDLEFRELKTSQADLETAALDQRPDLRAAKTGVTAAQSQVKLAKANGVQDLNVTFDYSRVVGTNTGSFFFNIPLPIFNRNQGEIARTKFALSQAELTAQASQEIVLADVRNGYEAVKSNEQIVQLYEAGYLQQAEESRDISYFAYRQGSAALLDYLDAERSYRAVQLQYRQALAAYMLALEQLRQAVGVRTLL
jgi:cobalt-zinc-cadmium efflux system outer membrane protein